VGRCCHAGVLCLLPSPLPLSLFQALPVSAPSTGPTVQCQPHAHSGGARRHPLLQAHIRFTPCCRATYVCRRETSICSEAWMNGDCHTLELQICTQGHPFSKAHSHNFPSFVPPPLRVPSPPPAHTAPPPRPPLCHGCSMMTEALPVAHQSAAARLWVHWGTEPLQPPAGFNMEAFATPPELNDPAFEERLKGESQPAASAELRWFCCGA